jgi:hypothetical protein
MSGWAEISARKPIRTSSWSSTSMIRMGIPASPSLPPLDGSVAVVSPRSHEKTTASPRSTLFLISRVPSR